MCDRGTPLMERAVCGCWTLRGLAAVSLAAGVAAAVMFDAVEAVVIGGLLAGAFLAGSTGWRLWRSDVRMIHRYYPSAPAVQAEAEPERLPWWERAQVGSRDSG